MRLKRCCSCNGKERHRILKVYSMLLRQVLGMLQMHMYVRFFCCECLLRMHMYVRTHASFLSSCIPLNNTYLGSRSCSCFFVGSSRQWSSRQWRNQHAQRLWSLPVQTNMFRLPGRKLCSKVFHWKRNVFATCQSTYPFQSWIPHSNTFRWRPPIRCVWTSRFRAATITLARQKQWRLRQGRSRRRRLQALWRRHLSGNPSASELEYVGAYRCM